MLPPFGTFRGDGGDPETHLSAHAGDSEFIVVTVTYDVLNKR